MLIKEAREKIEAVVGRKFVEVFTPENMKQIESHDKGAAGKALELLIGKALNNKSEPDFEDGELKTNKCTHTGSIKETIAVTQIDTIIDDLIQRQKFEDTHMYQKIKSLLYVPICEEGSRRNWVFLPSLHIDLTLTQYAMLHDQLEKDYYYICDTIKEMAENGEMLSTFGGKYLQIRPKAIQPYRPIYSKIYDKNVADKNFAFYLKRDFIKDIRLADKNYGKYMIQIINQISEDFK